ncbi:MAG: trypsin-like peptidase domain-containing protein [Deltaproteobacteria bacterium]|nr:trypsin-like peptidase domain-containing protein [Myxococcales bacterium]MDP3219371.1 trypsin-like peptidase domain-containing protein [Deltaproteobacteria bacterium]
MGDESELIRGAVTPVFDPAGTIVGTGFFVSPGRVVTAAHVVAQAGATAVGDEVRLAGGPDGARAKLLAVDTGFDLALLETVAVPGRPTLLLGTHKTCDGHQWRSFAHPAQGPRWANGEVDGALADGRIQLRDRTSGVRGGFSGAPVYDQATRRVIGVMVTRDLVEPEPGDPGVTLVVTAIAAEKIASLDPSLTMTRECPYRGLASFVTADREFWFGRRQVVDDLSARVLRGDPLVVLTGPSGSGKSSLLNAALLPSLQESKQRISWVLSMRPGAAPRTVLDHALEGSKLPRSAPGEKLAQTFERALATTPPGQRGVWIIDQIEELLVSRTAAEEADRDVFFGELIDLVGQIGPDLRMTVVIAFRQGFEGRLQDVFPALLDRFEHRRVAIPGVLDRESLKQIIEEPAKLVGLTISAERVNEIVLDAMQTFPATPGRDDGCRVSALPLIELSLFRLWQASTDNVLDAPFGGIQKSFDDFASEAMRGLDLEGQRAARALLASLVEFADGTRGVQDKGRRVERGSLPGTPVYQRALQRLIEGRVVVSSTEAGLETIELIHDSLIFRWPLFEEIRRSEREFRLCLQQCEAAQERWRKARVAHPQWWSDAARGELLQKELLKNAIRFMQARPHDMEGVREFVAASRYWRRWNLAAGVVLVLGVVTLAATNTYNRLQRTRELARSQDAAVKAASRERDNAMRSDLGAKRLLGRPFARGEALATAIQVATDTESSLTLWDRREILLRAIEQHSSAQALPIGPNLVPLVARFSRDGRWLILRGTDATQRRMVTELWDVRRATRISQMDDRPWCVPTPPGGGLHVGQTALINNCSESNENATLSPLLEHGIAWLTAPARAVVALEGGSLRVIDPESGISRDVPTSHSVITSMVATADGRFLFSAGLDGHVLRWDARTLAVDGAPMVHRGPAVSIAASRDGARVVAQGPDGACLFVGRPPCQPSPDTACRFVGYLPCRPSPEGSARDAVAISPDGHLAVIGSDVGRPNSLVFWDTETGTHVALHDRLAASSAAGVWATGSPRFDADARGVVAFDSLHTAFVRWPISGSPPAVEPGERYDRFAQGGVELLGVRLDQDDNANLYVSPWLERLGIGHCSDTRVSFLPLVGCAASGDAFVVGEDRSRVTVLRRGISTADPIPRSVPVDTRVASDSTDCHHNAEEVVSSVLPGVVVAAARDGDAVTLPDGRTAYRREVRSLDGRRLYLSPCTVAVAPAEDGVWIATCEGSVVLVTPQYVRSLDTRLAHIEDLCASTESRHFVASNEVGAVVLGRFDLSPSIVKRWSVGSHINEMRFSPDGEVVYEPRAGVGVVLWSSLDGHRVGTLQAPLHNSDPDDRHLIVRPAPDGHTVTAVDDDAIRTWNLDLDHLLGRACALTDPRDGVPAPCVRATAGNPRPASGGSP